MFKDCGECEGSGFVETLCVHCNGTGESWHGEGVCFFCSGVGEAQAPCRGCALRAARLALRSRVMREELRSPSAEEARAEAREVEERIKLRSYRFTRVDDADDIPRRRDDPKA